MILESDFKKLTAQSLELIETCRVSQATRAAAYRSYAQWIESGRAAGDLAIANQLYGFLQRLASHLYSPSEPLRFVIDSESHKTKAWLDKFAVGANTLSREWERKNIDVTFGLGVAESLSYGAFILKQSVEESVSKTDTGDELRIIDVDADLVMPWQFGVFNEGENSLHKQEAVVETTFLSKAEVWRRIRYLPDAQKLYRKILSSVALEGAGAPSSFMHQVLSTAVLDVTLANATRPMPGGTVQLSNSPNMATLGPQVAADLYAMHQLYVKDDDRGGDYTTIQVIEPDIMIAPYNNGRVVTKKTNLFCPDALPYTLIQPNVVAKYFWGRSEIVDLIMLQNLLSGTLDDVKRIIKLMLDKLLGLEGWEGDPMELLAQFRTTGVIGIPQGAKITDLTPQLPEVVLRFIEMILQMMERVSGFSNILSGSGEPGVRAGVHADTLMRTASPRLRDRSLIIERQCAAAADTTLAVLQAKDAKIFWTNDDDTMSDFLLSQFPGDRRVSVDAHSTSPIYHDDQQNLMAWAVKAGFVGGDSAIEDMPFQHKDRLLARFHEMQQQKAAMLQKLEKEDPIAFARAIGGGGHGGRKAA